MPSISDRRSSCWRDSPHSGFACAATSSYWYTRSRHFGCSATMSDTIRLTSGRVLFASARVKYLRGTDINLDAQTHRRVDAQGGTDGGVPVGLTQTVLPG